MKFPRDLRWKLWDGRNDAFYPVRLCGKKIYPKLSSETLKAGMQHGRTRHARKVPFVWYFLAYNTGWFTKMDSIEQQTAPEHTPDSCLQYSKFSAPSTGWLTWTTLKTLLYLSHVLLWYTQKCLCCIVAILFSTDAATRLSNRRAL